MVAASKTLGHLQGIIVVRLSFSSETLFIGSSGQYILRVTRRISRRKFGIIGSVQVGNAPFPRSLFLCFFWDSASFFVSLVQSASKERDTSVPPLPRPPLMESDASCSECAGSAMSIKFNKLPIYHLRNLQRALRVFFPSFHSKDNHFYCPLPRPLPFLRVTGYFLFRRFFFPLIWHRLTTILLFQKFVT